MSSIAYMTDFLGGRKIEECYDTEDRDRTKKPGGIVATRQP